MEVIIKQAMLTGIISIGLGSSLGLNAQQEALTIYSSATPGSISPENYRPSPQGHDSYFQVPGYAVVKSTRQHNLKKGLNQLSLSDVAALIDPTTVLFKVSNDNIARVLEQNYQFDLVNAQKLLQRYIGKNIVVEQDFGDSGKTVSGELLSATGGIILKDETGKIHSLSSYQNIRFPDLPGGLRTKPTLEWKLESSKSGMQDIELSYQTEGITWWADYNVVFDESKKCNLDLSSWVSIINQSGASFNNAKLKLVAGDLNRVETAQPVYKTRQMTDGVPGQGFQQKTFFEYHMYTLGRTADLPDNSTKQLELFPKVSDISCNKELVFDASNQFSVYSGNNFDSGYGRNSNADVNVYLRFNNQEKNNLGVPLPAGRIRVNQRDTDGSLELIGEDVIQHTPKDEQVLIKMGNSFDIKGERRQTNFQIDKNNHKLTEDFEITIRNHKSKSEEVVVRETLYRGANWKLSDQSHDFVKQDARHVHFNVKVPANSEVKVKYSVLYTW